MPHGPQADLRAARRQALLWLLPMALAAVVAVAAGEVVADEADARTAARSVVVLLFAGAWLGLRTRRYAQHVSEGATYAGLVLLALLDLLAQIGALAGTTDGYWAMAWVSYSVVVVLAPYVIWSRVTARRVAGLGIGGLLAMFGAAAVVRGFDPPALGVVAVPVVVAALAETLTATSAILARHEARARAEADLGRTDQLTGLANRRGVLPDLRSARSGDVLLLVDVDRFKRVNDVHGHDIGDLVLRRVANAMAGSVREVDHIARWGGEEFLVVATARDRGADGGVVAVVPDALPAAVELAERLRARVAGIEGEPGVTVSVGVADVLPDDADWQDALRRADACLYEAKRQGRDRVVVTPGGASDDRDVARSE